MKILQLRYILEIYRNALSISNAAETLYTSQPGISKQVRKLEQELGVDVFVRKGKHLTETTPAGQHIIAVAAELLDKCQQIKNIAQEYRDEKFGVLAIGTTHNQARYVLPGVIGKFTAKYPGIKLNIHQGTPNQIAKEASRGIVDMAITSESLEKYENLVLLPGYEWGRLIMLPKNHPLTAKSSVCIQDLAQYPIVTYSYGFSGRSIIDKAFEKHHLHPQIALTATDADVIKTYVRLGLGVGIVAEMAYDPLVDDDLVTLDATHLFGLSVTKIGFRRDLFLREFMYEFISLFVPTLTKEYIQQFLGQAQQQDVEELEEEE